MSKLTEALKEPKTHEQLATELNIKKSTLSVYLSQLKKTDVNYRRSPKRVDGKYLYHLAV